MYSGSAPHLNAKAICFASCTPLPLETTDKKANSPPSTVLPIHTPFQNTQPTLTYYQTRWPPRALALSASLA